MLKHWEYREIIIGTRWSLAEISAERQEERETLTAALRDGWEPFCVETTNEGLKRFHLKRELV